MNVFALSRIFYIASVLPLQKSFIKKVETSIGKFLWSSTGRLLRVSLADIKNSRDNGGLGLTCLASKGKSLMLSQLLRIVRNGDSKTVGHMLVWLGKLLEDFLPHMQSITALPKTPSYFETLADTLTQARITDVVSMVNSIRHGVLDQRLDLGGAHCAPPHFPGCRKKIFGSDYRNVI